MAKISNSTLQYLTLVPRTYYAVVNQLQVAAVSCLSRYRHSSHLNVRLRREWPVKLDLIRPYTVGFELLKLKLTMPTFESIRLASIFLERLPLSLALSPSHTLPAWQV